MKFALKLSAVWSKIANWFIRKLDDKRWHERIHAAITLNPKGEQLFRNQASSLRMAVMSPYSSMPFQQRDKLDKLNHFLFTVSVSAIQNILELSKVVGIQPMTGPVGIVFKLDCSETGEPTEVGRQVRLSVRKYPVEARTRKLAAELSVEAIQDAAALSQGFMAEVADSLGQEVAFEVITAALNDLRRLAEVNTLNVDSTEGSSLIDAIMTAGNNIAQDTRRGPGNYVIGSSKTLEKLQWNITAASTPVDRALKLVGELTSGVKVYEFPTIPDGELIVGYNGPSATDSGYVFCPYIPLLVSGTVIDPQTFAPGMRFMTRNGSHHIDSSAEPPPLVVSSSYYALLKV